MSTANAELERIKNIVYGKGRVSWSTAEKIAIDIIAASIQSDAAPQQGKEEEQKLQAAFDVWDRSKYKSMLSRQDHVESVPEDMIEYVVKLFEAASAVHGKIKRISIYGGSAFVIFEDDKCYRLNFGLYDNEITV